MAHGTRLRKYGARRPIWIRFVLFFEKFNGAGTVHSTRLKALVFLFGIRILWGWFTLSLLNTLVTINSRYEIPRFAGGALGLGPWTLYPVPCTLYHTPLLLNPIQSFDPRKKFSIKFNLCVYHTIIECTQNHTFLLIQPCILTCSSLPRTFFWWLIDFFKYYK